MRRDRLRLMTLFGTAFAGLVGGHVLGYLTIAPGDAARDLVLSNTGHGYLPRVTTLAVAAAILAGLGSARLGLLRHRGVAAEGPGVKSVAIRLAALQVAGFVVLEILERVVSGAPIAGLVVVLLVGLPAQVVVAWAGSVLLAVITSAARAVAGALARPPRARRRSPRLPRPHPDSRPARSLVWGSWAIRAPPVAYPVRR